MDSAELGAERCVVLHRIRYSIGCSPELSSDGALHERAELRDEQPPDRTAGADGRGAARDHSRPAAQLPLRTAALATMAKLRAHVYGKYRL